MGEQSLFKKLFRPQPFYILVLILGMFVWHRFMIKPNETIKTNSRYSYEGHFKYKEDVGIFSIFTEPYKHTVKGSTMGKIAYVVHYFDEEERNLKPEIDSLLIEFNEVFSTYIPHSKISIFNSGKNISTNSWMLDLHKRALHIHTNTSGAFDPTIKPLISFWGFGSSPGSTTRDSAKIAYYKSLVDYTALRVSNDSLIKDNPEIQLDYGAIAKGYAVDLVGDLLASKNITSYMVEIGGEITTGQKKANGKSWELAVEKPIKNTRQPSIFFSMNNLSEATSGNYRNFLTDSITGEKYQHTIDPTTGFPVKNTLLSATVLHEHCLEADAYATALVVMGTEKAISFAKENNLDVCLIYNEGNEEMKYHFSDGFKKLMNK